MKRKRILITGSNGLLGQNLISVYAANQQTELVATSLSQDKHPLKGAYPFVQADLTNEVQVRDLLNRFRPDVIIHTAAMTQVDPCEMNPDSCRKINVEATGFLADFAERFGSHLIYLSTDFVFSGVNGPYSESDPADPVSVYGHSKLEGEKIVQQLRVPSTVIRTILVYGLMPSMSRSNFVLWVRDALQKKEAIRVVEDQFRMPTLVDDLATGILKVEQLQAPGVYHLSGPEMISIYDFAIKIARFFSLDESLISPVSSRTLNQPGVRPPATGFILDKAMKELNYHPSDLQQGLQRMQALLEERSEGNYGM